jgi:SAM-dependent methyltransferase
MNQQSQSWSQVAADYEREFIDPYRADVRGNQIKRVLRRLADPESGIVADLGCGVGPLLPFLSQHFHTVHAIDFADGMLQRAKEHASACANVRYLQTSLLDLTALPPLDAAVAVNSLVMPSPVEQEQALGEIARCLKPGGCFLGIVPAMDSVHYATMLLVDRAVKAGMPIEAARKNAAHHADHAEFDFAFGQFCFRGIEQHFWQPFEIAYRFRRAGFTLKRLKKVHLSWQQCPGGKDLKEYPPPWDWFFLARSAVSDKSEHV